MASSQWNATIEDAGGEVRSFCNTIQGVSLSVPLNASAEVNASFSLDGDDAKQIMALLDSNNGVYFRLTEEDTPRFFGQLTDLQVDVGDDSSVTARFADLMVQYAGIYTYTVISGSSYRPIRFPRSGSASVATIVTKLMQTGEPLIPLTVSGTVGGGSSYHLAPEGAVVTDVLDQAVKNGWMEWYVEPDVSGGTACNIKIAANHGNVATLTDPPKVVFQAGPPGMGNVLSATLQYRPPVNKAYIVSDNNAVTLADDATSVATYGEYGTTISTQLDSWQDAVGYEALRQDWRRVVELTLEPSVCPRPWTDWNLGDLVAVGLQRDALSYIWSERVNQFEIAFNESMIEDSIRVSFETDQD